MPMTKTGHIVLIILAMIGAIAVIAFLIMLLVHGRMMGGQRPIHGRLPDRSNPVATIREVSR